MSTCAYDLRSIEVARDRTTVLRIEQLRIEAGKITCIVGPNGSGKSTLLHLLAFLGPPDAGTISFQGKLVDFNRDLTALRRRTTLVAQEPFVLQRSVRANLRYGLLQRGIRADDRIDDTLERVGLAGFASRHARRLSGGERQRVAIARAIVLDTEAILLDEPTASVDGTTRAAIEDIVRALASRGTTVVLSTHDLGQARRIGDEIVALEQGELASTALHSGTREEGR